MHIDCRKGGLIVSQGAGTNAPKLLNEITDLNLTRGRIAFLTQGAELEIRKFTIELHRADKPAEKGKP
jgi:hypothetical protein